MLHGKKDFNLKKTDKCKLNFLKKIPKQNLTNKIFRNNSIKIQTSP